MPNKTHDPNEILSVLDEKDQVIGSAIRKEVHEKGLWHRETYVFIINSKKEILLQKRTDRHIWDFSAAGHVPHGQEYLEAAQRETQEELGLSIDLKEFTKIAHGKIKKKEKGKINNRIYQAFVVRKDIKINEITPDKGEIEELKYFNKEKVEDLVKNNSELTLSCFILLKEKVIEMVS